MVLHIHTTIHLLSATNAKCLIEKGTLAITGIYVYVYGEPKIKIKNHHEQSRPTLFPALALSTKSNCPIQIPSNANAASHPTNPQ
jgi:hypothetical protein